MIAASTMVAPRVSRMNAIESSGHRRDSCCRVQALRAVVRGLRLLQAVRRVRHGLVLLGLFLRLRGVCLALLLGSLFRDDRFALRALGVELVLALLVFGGLLGNRLVLALLEIAALFLSLQVGLRRLGRRGRLRGLAAGAGAGVGLRACACGCAAFAEWSRPPGAPRRTASAIGAGGGASAAAARGDGRGTPRARPPAAWARRACGAARASAPQVPAWPSAEPAAARAACGRGTARLAEAAGACADGVGWLSRPDAGCFSPESFAGSTG